MITARHPLFCLFLAAACTPLEAPTGQQPTGEPAVVDVATPTPPAARPSVVAAVGSVRLEQDCPDPPSVSAHTEAAQAARSVHALADSAEREGKRSPHACDQSTVQMSLDNTGASAARVTIASISLRDLQSDGIVAPVASRGPSVFGPESTYVPWDETVAGKTTVQVSYRLTPPDWGAVEAKLGGSSSQTRDFALEVTLEVDGKPLTVRSPAFRRAAQDKFEMVET